MRREYMQAGLQETDLADDPIAQFKAWFDAARRTSARDPNAMTLATVDPDGRPSARIVLLKQVDTEGFVFYTNYRSRKGRALASHPAAALVFWWDALERQVRVEGSVEKVDPSVSDAYFHSRPYASRLGAVASEQSAVIPSRATLETRMSELSERYGEGDVPRPDHWGGYRVRPQAVEFWQGRASRLHDRLRYTRDGDAWQVQRLAP